MAQPRPRGRIAHLRLRQRIVLFGLLPLLVLYVVIGAVGVSLTYDALWRDGEEAPRDRTDTLGVTIDAANVDAITVPRTMALAQSYGMFGRRSATLDHAKALLGDDPGLLATHVAFEPDAGGFEAASLPAGLQQGALDPATGRFIPWVVRDREASPFDLVNLVDMPIEAIGPRVASVPQGRAG